MTETRTVYLANPSHDIQMIFDWIVEYKRTHDGNSPTLREMMRACKISSLSVAYNQLRRLERAGLIRFIGGPSKPRCLAIVGGEWRMNGAAK
jgi:hypothetical protein